MTAVLDTAIPTGADELSEFLQDDKRMKDILTDASKIGELVKNYHNAFEKKNVNFSAQVREETQRALAEFYASNGVDGKPPLDLAPGKPHPSEAKKKRLTIHNHGQALSVPQPYNKRAPGAALDGQDVDIADLLRMQWHKQSDRTIMARRDEWEKLQNSAGSVIPADGGLLIPEVLRDELLSVALELAVVRPRASVLPMSSLRLPIPVVDETTHVGSIYGGISASWTEEGGLLAASQASFGRVILEAKKLATYADVPNELVNDAPAFSGFLDMAFPKAIAYFEDVKFFNGLGVGEPLGWVNAPCAVKVDPAVTNKIAWGDVVQMFSQMLPSSLGTAVWICSPDAFVQLAQLTFGTGSFPVLFPVGGGGQSMGMTLLGRPVIISEKAPAVGTDGWLSFVDLTYYLIGDRQQMEAASSTDYKFANDMTSFRVIQRVDGRPWLLSSLAPENGGSNQLSPIVQLSATHT